MDPVEMYSQDTETSVTETSTRLTGERETETTVYPNDQPTGGDAGMEAEDVEVTVLDPDHPLMRRFQEAFREQTQKQIGKITCDFSFNKLEFQTSGNFAIAS